ncbi:MAG: hypothetical protein A2Y56_02790 [Candidatus Aminicenantes bacterium RBG_13_63_10]|nr:MAG: hypothetical protein A2Y56_02790 [Candidatus Aminicenantes bacterium RBG_13_63_10]
MERMNKRPADEYQLGDGAPAVAARLAEWQSSGFLKRLWAKDAALWTFGQGAASEIVDRLGWLALPERMRSETAGIMAFAEEVKASGFTRAVILGMGGSSLAPEVFRGTFRPKPGYPELLVLDSTHPAAVAAAEKLIDPVRTLFIVSSKSGTTIEPLSLFRYFWDRLSRRSEPAGGRFIAVTDPGTPLAGLAAERKFRRVFLSPPDVGGRFSGLSPFGLVPAALMGIDIGRLLERARFAAAADAPDENAAKSPGLRLGAALAELGRSHNKLTILASASLHAFPEWLEQLVAESLGKDGRGILPIIDEPLAAVESYGRDRMFVTFLVETDQDHGLENHLAALEEAGQPVIRIRLLDVWDIGREMFRWETATAAAGAALGVQPFDQPDVELAKVLARKAMAETQPKGEGDPGGEVIVSADSDGLGRAVAGWLAQAKPKDYVALQAFLAPDDDTTRALQDIRRAILKKTGLATTLGFGPRFLHSTGQYHKGGPNEGLFLQVLDDPVPDLAVPETDDTFGRLIRGQALGDGRALEQKGRRILRVNLKHDVAGGLERLRRAI